MLRTTYQPVLAAFVPITVLAVAASAQAFIDGATVRGIVSAGLAILIAGATALVRQVVTPIAKLTQGPISTPRDLNDVREENIKDKQER